MPSRSNAQVYDVNINNGHVDVEIINQTDLFNNAYDANLLDDFKFSGSEETSPLTSNYLGNGQSGQSEAANDYMDFTYSTPNTISNDPLAPTKGNTLLTGARYFNFGSTYWMMRTVRTYFFNNTPLQHDRNDSAYALQVAEKFVVPNNSRVSTFFNWTTFKNDIIGALIGSDNFQFFVRFAQALAAAPSVANYTYTVPAVFGFDSGFTFTIPFNDVLYGSGNWASFSTVISFFRYFLSLIYYTTVAFCVVNCVFKYA